ncbi:hypothetical protein [Methylobacterium oxalidis]|nr:hypothetical protein [Methylobacterium oxalidis]
MIVIFLIATIVLAAFPHREPWLDLTLGLVFVSALMMIGVGLSSHSF